MLQGLRYLPMSPGPAVVSQISVQGVLDEGMGKAVAPRVGHLADQGNCSGGLEDVQQVHLVGLGGPARRSRSKSDRSPPQATAHAGHPCPGARPVLRSPRAPSGQGRGVEGVLGYPVSCRVLADCTCFDQVAEYLADKEGLPSVSW